jgi:hypothetical protein
MSSLILNLRCLIESFERLTSISDALERIAAHLKTHSTLIKELVRCANELQTQDPNDAEAANSTRQTASKNTSETHSAVDGSHASKAHNQRASGD